MVEPKMTIEQIMYVEPRYTLMRMEAALKAEKQKYKATPITLERRSITQMAAASGYVVMGYSLIEQGLNGVLILRDRKPEKTHSLSDIFAHWDPEDRDFLRTYYEDFRICFPTVREFPLKTLDEFLKYLDGPKSNQGQNVGSLAWRYYPTEKVCSKSMSLANIDFLHEVADGCVQLLRKELYGSERPPYSYQLFQERTHVVLEWLGERWNRDGGWTDNDRVEILWGPDRRGRYDFLRICKGGQCRRHFGVLPDTDEPELEIVDKRSELEGRLQTR